VTLSPFYRSRRFRVELKQPLPGTYVTPDEICQNGLIRFEVLQGDDQHADDYDERRSGYLRIPYVWILVLCSNVQLEPNVYEDLIGNDVGMVAETKMSRSMLLCQCQKAPARPTFTRQSHSRKRCRRVVT
jgi:hypothetical protein